MENKRYEMALHACRTVPYYRKKIEQNRVLLKDLENRRGWEELPLTEKNQIALMQDQLISEDFLGELVTGQLLRSHTSGSTGTYLDVYWNHADYTAALVPLWMERYRYAGIHTKDRVCVFNTTLKDQQEYQIVKSQMMISKQNLSREKLLMLYEKILEFDPVWFLVHPGIAAVFLQIVKENKLPIPSSLKYIELTGEMVLEGLKEELEKTFQCKVRCHYGTMEVNTIGVEENGIYRIFENSVYIEVIGRDGKVLQEGETGDIYVTSLHNRAMPVIRYGTGDQGRIVTGKDGRRGIELKRARKNDLLYISEGHQIPPDVLLGPVEQINQAMGLMIYQFRVVQQSLHSLLVKVVLDEEMYQHDFIRLYQELFTEEWKGGFDWKYEFYDTVQINQDTGKYGWFVNQITKEVK